MIHISLLSLLIIMLSNISLFQFETLTMCDKPHYDNTNNNNHKISVEKQKYSNFAVTVVSTN